MTAVATADEFNAAHPVGTPVLAFPGSKDGRALHTKTRTPAWTLGHGAAVVSVEGYAGGIALTHVEVIPTAVTTAEARVQTARREYDAACARHRDAERRHPAGMTPAIREARRAKQAAFAAYRDALAELRDAEDGEVR